MTINKALLTVTADDKFKIQGQVNPNFTAIVSGFVNGDNSSVVSGSLNFSTSADKTSPSSTYAITPSGLTSSTYDIVYTSGNLHVIPVSSTIPLASNISDSTSSQDYTLQNNVNLNNLIPDSNIFNDEEKKKWQRLGIEISRQSKKNL